MRLAELSERSGVPTATIKFYLREGLLPPGERVNARQSRYEEDHLRRLRLVRALIQVGGMSVATAREVLTVVDDDSRSPHQRFGAAHSLLPPSAGPPGTSARAEGPGSATHGDGAEGEDEGEPGEPGPHERTARESVDALLTQLGWDFSRRLRHHVPAYTSLINAVAALSRLGYPCDIERLLPYARAAAQIAETDTETIAAYDTLSEQVEAAVACTVLYEPVLLSLRRLAQTEESNHRFGEGS
ncbi:MerR family transcriptional regulator [Streptomyces sp. AJS327]|uniref:MerR family transcriptional regulator n=1 Tax=Streptomyces sp. AJS327 TaxID=2545265 RepID=UPI0015DE2EA5|nr:MerR family transcriptional regulator [Streptomyces sp. AJS327]MBA0051768.1 MerR family transcriptional regulator [Streptomyces sp. AJS327]